MRVRRKGEELPAMRKVDLREAPRCTTRPMPDPYA